MAERAVQLLVDSRRAEIQESQEEELSERRDSSLPTWIEVGNLLAQEEYAGRDPTAFIGEEDRILLTEECGGVPARPRKLILQQQIDPRKVLSSIFLTHSSSSPPGPSSPHWSIVPAPAHSSCANDPNSLRSLVCRKFFQKKMDFPAGETALPFPSANSASGFEPTTPLRISQSATSNSDRLPPTSSAARPAASNQVPSSAQTPAASNQAASSTSPPVVASACPSSAWLFHCRYCGKARFVRETSVSGLSCTDFSGFPPDFGLRFECVSLWNCKCVDADDRTSENDEATSWLVGRVLLDHGAEKHLLPRINPYFREQPLVRIVPHDGKNSWQGVVDKPGGEKIVKVCVDFLEPVDREDGGQAVRVLSAGQVRGEWWRALAEALEKESPGDATRAAADSSLTKPPQKTTRYGLFCGRGSELLERNFVVVWEGRASNSSLWG